MRELYISPKVEIIEFEVEDIITASTDLDSFDIENSKDDIGWSDFM